MSNWTIVDMPFPRVSFIERKAEAPVDQGGASVDQDRALHKWVNDVRHWVMSGRAGSEEEVMAMLAAKGCPNPEQVVQAYHMTEGLQDQLGDTAPQHVAPPEESMPPPAAPVEAQPAPPPGEAEPEMGLPTGEEPTYADMFGEDPQQGSTQEKFEDAEEDEDFYPKKKDEDDDDERISSAFTLTADLLSDEYRHKPNPYDADTTPFGNRTIIGPGGQLTKEPQVSPRKDKPSPDAQFAEAMANDEAYITHLMNTRGITRDEADAILTEHAMGNVTAGVQKGSPYPENSEKNAPDHSAPGHHLPDKVNEIYNAIMREHPEYGKEKAMKIAWERSGLHKEKDSSGSFQGVPGRIVSRYTDVWGTEMARFATEFGEFDVPVESIEPAETAAPVSPVDEIESFLADIDPAGFTPESIDARVDNLTQVVNAATKTIREGKVSVREQMKLDEIALTARLELGELRELRKQAGLEAEQSYLDTQPQYEVAKDVAAGGAYTPVSGDWLEQAHQDMLDEAEGTNFDQMIQEQPELLMNDVPDAVVADQGAVTQIAASYIEPKTAGLAPEVAEDVQKRFIERMEQVRRDALASRKEDMKRQASTENYEGPDEGLFL